MKALGSLGRHERAMDARFKDRSRDGVFRLKKRISYATAYAMNPQREQSPMVLALSAKTLATAVRFIIRSKGLCADGETLGVTHATAMKLCASLIARTRLACEGYRMRGINPQVEVGINPSINYCKDVYAEYRAWASLRAAEAA